ncbi:hypothetical protein PGA2_95p670 (plasmid) [Phaeobacter inhibens 2.10]|nr:hypothetical protein PGA2_95p670 [Phaeobacter inhibens 2.10]
MIGGTGAVVPAETATAEPEDPPRRIAAVFVLVLSQFCPFCSERPKGESMHRGATHVFGAAGSAIPGLSPPPQQQESRADTPAAARDLACVRAYFRPLGCGVPHQTAPPSAA